MPIFVPVSSASPVFMFMVGILKMAREVFGYIGDHYYLNRFKNTNRIKPV